MVVSVLHSLGSEPPPADSRGPRLSSCLASLRRFEESSVNRTFDCDTHHALGIFRGTMRHYTGCDGIGIRAFKIRRRQNDELQSVSIFVCWYIWINACLSVL